MNAKSFSLSAQGASHIRKNKECQDASGHYYDDKMAIAIVCDGHGGDDYMRSAFGSQFACNAAERNIRSFMENITKDKFFEDPEKLIVDLEASIINVWNQLIYAHYEKNPFTEEELSGISEKAKKRYTQEGRIESAYGTTLIAVAMTSEFWFGIQIGDGKCVAVNPEGKFVQPIPWNDKCFLNATTSICDSDALTNFRHFYHTKLPVAVFVGSDGIDDCFSNNEQLNNLYKTIVYSFGTSEFDEAIDGLKDYLPRLSAKGSGDDVSIASILDFDLLPELEIVKEFDREKEKARVEENARKEAERNEAEKRRVEEEHARFQQKKKNAAIKKKNKESVFKENMPKFCAECGSKLAESAKFCPNCGAKIVSVVEKNEQQTVQPQIQLFPVKRYDRDNENETLTQHNINIVDNAPVDISTSGEGNNDISNLENNDSTKIETTEEKNNEDLVEINAENYSENIDECIVEGAESVETEDESGETEQTSEVCAEDMEIEELKTDI